MQEDSFFECEVGYSLKLKVKRNHYRVIPLSFCCNNERQAWLLSVDMGLGHQRAAYPLRDLCLGQVFNADSGELATRMEQKLWKRMRHLYESLSRLNDLPVIGGFFFGLLDKIQEINPYYPFRDLSEPTIQVKYLKRLIAKGLGKNLVEKLVSTGLPLLSTFYAVALAAASQGYPNVYLVATDSDLNRVWVADNPKQSPVQYFAPCSYTLNRLKEYGVPDEKIWLTGFPLPKENLGGPDLETLKYDLGQRLIYLDPNRRFWSLHRVEAEYYLSPENCVKSDERLLTLTFAVGGAGAQKEIGAAALKSLAGRIRKHQIRFNLVAGLRSEVRDYFQMKVAELNLNDELGSGVNIIYASNLDQYFQKFNLALRTTDILWTKPSELSFYAGLGLPIIMAPPLGAHEHMNRKWLLEIHAGIIQQEPDHCSEWLFDLLNEGRLAEAAWDGFLKARKCGTYKIEEIITTGQMTHDLSPLKR